LGQISVILQNVFLVLLTSSKIYEIYSAPITTHKNIDVTTSYEGQSNW